MNIKNYYQGLIIIALLPLIIESVLFGIIAAPSQWSNILAESLFIEIIPFSIIYFYGYKIIKEDLKRLYFIPAFIVMVIMDIIFSLNITQNSFYSLGYKENEYINFILIPFMEFFYYIKIKLYMTEYFHIGIYAALIYIILKIKKPVKQKTEEKDDIKEITTLEDLFKLDLFKKEKDVFQGIFFRIYSFCCTDNYEYDILVKKIK